MKNRLDFQAQLSRHSHDVSAGYTSSITTGMIIPQYFDILNPGDSIYYRTHLFSRLQDVVTAFLGEIDIHVDYFFVPLQMLYTPFGQIFAQTDDYLSSVYSSALTAKDTFPLIQLDHTADISTAYNSGGVPEMECLGKKLMRMLNAFDMNPFEVLHSDFAGAMATPYTKVSTDQSDTLCYNPPIAPWIPCAYQAIYQKYFRNDELEKLQVHQYNLDQYYSATTPISYTQFFDLNWAQRPADYFTSIRVSPIASVVNRIGSTGQFPFDGGSPSSLIAKVDKFLNPDSTYLGSQGFGKVQTFGNASNAFEFVSNTLKTSEGTASVDYLNTANIRALFAVDKFSRIYGRADKTYDDQILAHFGIKIPHDVKHDITHLKHYRAVLQADPIYGTANTQNMGTDITSNTAQFIGTIGQVGGQGQVTLDTDQEKFTAPVHGVFMAVAYVLTKPRYTETFSKLHLLTERLAFPIPEYDKLGAEPVYRFEGSRYFLQPTDSYGHNFRAARCGWQNRYERFKRRYNRASLIYEDPTQGWSPAGGVSNIYAPYVISHQPYFLDVDALATSEFVNAMKFFENPHALDSIMVRPYTSGWSNAYFASPWTAFQSDPILTEFMCFAKKVSWMSETGEPDL